MMESQFTTMASEGRGSRIGNMINKSIIGEKFFLNIPEEYEDLKSYEVISIIFNRFFYLGN